MDAVPDCIDPEEGAGIVALPKLKEHAPSSRIRKTTPTKGKEVREEEGASLILPP